MTFTKMGIQGVELEEMEYLIMLILFFRIVFFSPVDFLVLICYDGLIFVYMNIDGHSFSFFTTFFTFPL